MNKNNNLIMIVDVIRQVEDILTFHEGWFVELEATPDSASRNEWSKAAHILAFGDLSGVCARLYIDVPYVKQLSHYGIETGRHCVYHLELMMLPAGTHCHHLVFAQPRHDQAGITELRREVGHLISAHLQNRGLLAPNVRPRFIPHDLKAHGGLPATKSTYTYYDPN